MVEVDLCEDTLDEIIARLPPKFILQFRCVSKSWRSRIDSSNFIRKQSIHSAARARRTANVAHQLHLENDVYKLLHGLKPEGPFLELDSLNFPDACNVFDSCYGIFCLYKKAYIPTITLWNPSIRRILNVPNVPYEFCLPYTVVFGFGYDPIADDYSIVGLSFKTTLQTLFLYSTNTNAWSKIDLPKADPPIKVQIPLPCTTQGTIHQSIWIGYLIVISDDGEDRSMWLRKLDNNNVASWSKPFDVNFSDVKRETPVYNIENGEFEVPKAYNPLSGVFRVRVTSSNSCDKYEINSYVETLALLDKENCSTSKETTMFEKILSLFTSL
ncbi:F-box/kelch-repeat protein At2g43445-like [Rutidosis leptorrhynchoides]|uniref:F-box/kelch-repeat protein At2g43445-like n=1 Tax=Rutidosis leptorrhynchoides TaxID=125765 RepID=UPI003A98F0DC